MIFICKIKLKILANVNKVILKKNWYSNKQLYVRCFNLYIFYFVQAVTNILIHVVTNEKLFRSYTFYHYLHFSQRFDNIWTKRALLLVLLKVGLYDEIFLSQMVKFFFFDSFFSTFDACIQLRNVNEIFQSTIMKVFQKKKFLPDF